MTFTIPTKEEIVAKYAAHNSEEQQEQALIARRAELKGLNKDDLIELILKSEEEKPTGTVQELARAILSDPELIAANYTDIANAIREIIPGSKTTDKSIASYVSKKKEEWDLPQRIRVR